MGPFAISKLHLSLRCRTAEQPNPDPPGRQSLRLLGFGARRVARGQPSPTPGRPSFNGQYEIVSVSPGLNVLPVMPRWSSDGGAEPSKLHRVSLPSGFLTFR